MGLSFEHEYDEPGNNIYGIASYNHQTGEYKNTYLDDDDFDSIKEEYDEVSGIEWYSFEGKDYEVKEDILKILIRRKI